MNKIAAPSPSSQVVAFRPARRGRIVSNISTTSPGQAKPGTPHGGGGPENRGAVDSETRALPFYQSQPSWRGEELLQNEYFGYAAPSVTLDMSGIPANNFRNLGDNHGGRG